MQSTHVVVESTTPISTRMQQVCGMFDAPPEKRQRLEWNVNMPTDEKPWKVGLIHGPSGSGKTTVARHLFGKETTFGWSKDQSVVDDFPPEMSVERIAKLCGAVGLNTIPCWLRPHHVLSNGEQFRANMARLLAEAKTNKPIMVDEFTSVVDRQVAKITSHAVSKAIRKQDAMQFVAVSCHSDIIEWLQPDWTLDMGANAQFEWRRLRPRPQLHGHIQRVHHSEWSRFARYHYLTASLAKAARCYCLSVNNEPAGFAALLYRPHPKVDDIYGISRMVTLPDYQGVGVRHVLSQSLGSMMKALGYRLNSYPAHPSLVRSLDRNINYRLMKKPGTFSPSSLGNNKSVQRGSFGGRPNATFQYIGPAHPDIDEAGRIMGIRRHHRLRA